MNQYFKNQFILVLSISLTLIACNQNDKKAEPASTDTTNNATTETVQPATQDATPDAVKAAPDLYMVIKDTLGIRVLEANYKPGDSSVMHSHPDYAVYAINGATAEFTEKDGTKHPVTLKAGQTMIAGAGVHAVKNTGKGNIKVLLVEVNRSAGTVPVDASMDATKVAPDLYKVRNDSLGIRIIEINYKPGQSSAMHSHPDAVVYAINGGTVEFTTRDGAKQTNELKTGMSLVTPSGAHSVKNIGKTNLKAILVEVGRPMK